MGALSIWHVGILAAIAVLLFGGSGKISDLMADLAKGIKAFRGGMNDPESDGPQIRAAAPERLESAALRPSSTRE